MKAEIKLVILTGMAHCLTLSLSTFRLQPRCFRPWPPLSEPCHFRLMTGTLAVRRDLNHFSDIAVAKASACSCSDGRIVFCSAVKAWPACP